MNEFQQRVKPLIADVPGWLTDEEGEALYELARRCTGRGVIVEIGSWKGKSTICLGLGSRAAKGVRIYAVDPHADYRFGDFKANVERAGIADLVTPVSSLSQDAAPGFDEPIELLFVDGSHVESDVRTDFDQWVPKVVDGGWVAFHDTTWTAGPRRVVGERVYRSRTFKDVRFVGRGCSISQASASMMTQLLKNSTVPQALLLAERMSAMMHGDDAAATDKTLGDLRALAGVSKFPVRIKCALLPWNALTDAVKS